MSKTRKTKADLLKEVESLRAQVAASAEALVTAGRAAAGSAPSGEHVLCQAFDGGTDAAFVVDTDFVVMYANRALRTMTGLDGRQIVGRKCYDTIGRSACNRDACVLSRILGGQDRIGPLVVWDMCGSEACCHTVTAWAVRGDDGRVRAAAVELRGDDERMRTVLASMNQITIAIYDLEGKVLAAWTNDEGRAGMQLDQVRGKNLRDIYPPELAEARIARIREAADASGPLRDVYRAPLAAGEYWLETTLSPLRDAAGKASAVMGLVRDITDQKKLEADLRRSEQALENKDIALHELVAVVEDEKHQIARQIRANVDRIIMPLLDDLSRDVPAGRQKHYDAVRQGLQEIASPFGARLSTQAEGLSPAEIRVGNLVRSGMSTKDIAEFLHVSVSTVNKHREHIRRKLGLAGKDVNLATHLAAMAAESPET